MFKLSCSIACQLVVLVGLQFPSRCDASTIHLLLSRATRTHQHKYQYHKELSLEEQSYRGLYTRSNAEHVVLANCITDQGTLSSEMAYFTGSPNSSPDDTAVVSTPFNTTRKWADSRTSTLFLDTNVRFTADLGPDVADGEWAGTGDNGYGTFVCWEKASGDLYSGDTGEEENRCSGVYDCDHAATPSESCSLHRPHVVFHLPRCLSKSLNRF